MSYALFALAFLVGMALVVRPWLTRHVAAWPAEPPDERDDVARAVSSLRDLEFARAAGTLAPADHARLRDLLERSAFARRPAERTRGAPVRTLVIAALLAGIAAILVVFALPPAVGDRAPGVPITGSAPAGPTLAELEARARASARDVPTLLALGDAYAQSGRASDAVRTYQAVLQIDRENVPAVDGLALVLDLSGEHDGALLAVERALAIAPKDPDALFLKGLILYRKSDWRGAVDVWTAYLEVGEFHPAASLVRPLYKDAKAKLGR